MGKNNSKKYKRTAALIALPVLVLAVCLAVTLFGRTDTEAAGEKYTDSELALNLQIDKINTCDWQNAYVTLTNNTGKDLSGTIKLSFTNTFYMSQISDDNFVVEKEFVIPQGVTKRTEIPVYILSSNANAVKCDVLSDRGVLYRTYSYNLPNVGNMGDIVSVGWLSEDRNVPPCVKGLEMSLPVITQYKQYFVSAKAITADTFPSNLQMMNAYSLIILDSIDFSASSSFTESQKQLIIDYIENGGAVIVGTGVKNSSGLEILKKYFSKNISEACVYVGKKDLKSTYYASNVGYTDFKAEGVDTCAITDDNFLPLSNTYDSEICIYRHKTYKIYLTTFYIGDSALKDRADTATMLLSRIKESDTTFATSLRAGESQTDNKSFLSKDSMDRTPKGMVILLILSLYIVALIVLYIILRYKKKEKFMWIALPATAIIFSIFFGIYGVILVGRNMTNAVTMVRLNPSGSNPAFTETGILVSKGGTHKISSTEDDVLIRPYENQLYSEDKFHSFYGGTTYNYLSQVSRGEHAYSFFEYTDKTYGMIDAKISTDGPKMTVDIVNNTGKDLSDAFVIANGQALYVGDIAAGDSAKAEINNIVVMSYSVGISNVDMSSLLTVIYNACYKPLGLSTFEMNQDDLPQSLTTTQDHYFGPRSMDYFETLKKDPDMFQRAYRIMYAADHMIREAQLSRYAATDGAFICAFDDSSDVSVLLDGRRAGREFADTLVYRYVSRDDVINTAPLTPHDIIQAYDEKASVNVTVGKNSDGDSIIQADDPNTDAIAVYCIHLTADELRFNNISFDFNDGGRGEYFILRLENMDHGYYQYATAEQLKPIDGKCTIPLQGLDYVMPPEASYRHVECYLDDYNMEITIDDDDGLGRYTVVVLACYDKKDINRTVLTEPYFEIPMHVVATLS